MFDDAGDGSLNIGFDFGESFFSVTTLVRWLDCNMVNHFSEVQVFKMELKVREGIRSRDGLMSFTKASEEKRLSSSLELRRY